MASENQTQTSAASRTKSPAPATLAVTKRDGTNEPFNADKINRSIERACVGLADPTSKVTKVATETRLTIYDGITSEEMDKATINAALQNISEDIEYDKIATRLLAKTVYRRVVGKYGHDDTKLSDKHRQRFPGHITEGVKQGHFDSRMASAYDLEKLAAALDLERDERLTYVGLSSLMDRYAIKDQDQDSIETPQYFFMRVAMGMAYAESQPTEAAIAFYDKMSKLEYVAGGSTNVNAGTVGAALSNCFLLEIQDDIEHIAKSISDVLILSKTSGGLGASITKLRASGSLLSSSNTVSSGPTPFAKIIDTSIQAIIRGGKKKGALCFYMENWHLDFPDFIDWKHNAGDDYLRMRTANTAVFITDEFMKRVEAGDSWYLFDPKETPDLVDLYGEAFSRRYAEYVADAEAGKLRKWKKVPAQELMRQTLVSLQTTSHPWLTWKDAINLRALNNNTGTIHMSNLCTEICLPQDRENIAVCNLASVNLAAHLKPAGDDFDWDRMAETVRLVVRHLDNLIDINTLPVPEAAKSDRENRAVGLGVMGLADAIEQLGHAYDTPETYELVDRLFEFISYHAIDASADLAKERGSYPNFKGSEWSKGKVPMDTIARLEAERGRELEVPKGSRWEGKRPDLDWDVLRRKVKRGIRNATLMAVAPNANIGLVGGTTPGIDPRFSQVFSRSKFSGKYLDLNHNLVKELQAAGVWEDVRTEIVERHGDISAITRIPERIRNVYKTSFSTSPYAFLEVAARAQKWVDQALSRNMYLETRDIDETMAIYATGWRKGVKSTYYLHMKPRHNAEQSTTRVNKADITGKVGFGALRVGTATAPAQPALPTRSSGQPALPTMPPQGVPVAPARTETPAAETPAPAPAQSAPIPKIEAKLVGPEAAASSKPAKPSNAPVAPTAAPDAEACPIDPQERLQCDSCQ
jgi:ribonucleoside-diphosphate reductase alpha chain